MKAAVLTTYGPPEVVQIKDVEKPVPEDNEVLIKVCAASLNPLDRTMMRGMPYLVRMAGGLREPKDPRLGVDAAGRVEAVGRNVTHFKPGDEVFGMCRGAFAEYVCVPESAVGMSVLAMKPETARFEQAAAAPVAGLTALQGLRDKGRIQPGQKVLINGAAGGVGTFAVQMAKSFGADVTGVCSTRNAQMVRSLGADRVIDYTREDFTRSGERYDLLLDCVGNHSLSACRRILNPKGKFIVVGGRNGRWLGPVDRLFKAVAWSWFVGDTIAFIAKANAADLAVIQELMDDGKITPVIDRSYGLSEVAEAMRHLETGHVRGKVVIILQ
jgi:NADPH:quinone reductase-like Zn-dependent oxidoreductase